MGRRPWRVLVVAAVLCLPAVIAAAEGVAQPPAQMLDCPALASQVSEENRRLREEVRQVKRELALLNQNLEKPGAREIIAGIGFILGLFGAAALVSAHRQGAKEGQNAHR